MGQRHQVFLIARLVPHGSTDGKAYYRCVAARHHQWCYGTLPLAATYRFVTLLKNPNNVEIIRDELRRAQNAYGRKGQAPKMPLMALPYASLLLAQAWDTDLGCLDAPYVSGVGFDRGCLSPNMGSFDGDNNDGITIIDITDPTNPAHCFVLGQGGAPADGSRYISRYYTLPSVGKNSKEKVDTREPDFEPGSDEEDDFAEDAEATGMAGRVREVVSDLKDVRLITSAMLAEAWPKEYAATQPEENSSAPGSEESTGSQSKEIPSLVNLSMAPAIDNALSSKDADQLEQLEEMVWMAGNAELMKKALATKNPIPDAAMTLLAKILAHELETTNPSVLDLSILPALSSDQITLILKTLGTTSDIKSLNLSGNQNISVAVLTDILTTLPGLLRLVLLNTSIADEDLLELMSSSPKLFYNLQDLVHPAFLRPVSPSQEGHQVILEALHPAYRHGITMVIADSNAQGAFASVPFFNLDKLISCLDYQMSILTSPKNKDPLFSWSYSQSALGSLITMSTGTTIVSSGKIKDEDEKGKGKSAETVGVSGGNNYDSRTISSIPRTQSMDCFVGVGWMFVLSTSMHSAHGPAYGFVKVAGKATEDMIEPVEVEGAAEAAAADNSGSSEAPPKPIQSTRAPCKIYDVRGFVDEMVKEGRPAPSEDVVLSFERTVSGKIDDDEKSEDNVDMPGMLPSDREAMARMLRDSKIPRLISDSEFQRLKSSCEMMVLLRQWGAGF